MGLFGKKKSEAYRLSDHDGRPPLPVNSKNNSESYEPPRLLPKNLVVEVDNESRNTLTQTEVDLTYSKSATEFDKIAEQTLAAESETNVVPSLSSVDGPSPHFEEEKKEEDPMPKAAPTMTEEPNREPMLRYESAKPPNLYKAPLSPASPEIHRDANFPVSPTSLQTTPPLSPRSHYQCMPSSNASAAGAAGACALPSLQHDSKKQACFDTKKVDGTISISSQVTMSPVQGATPSATCGCLEISGDGYEQDTVDENGFPISQENGGEQLPSTKGLVYRFNSFSQYIRSHSFLHHPTAKSSNRKGLLQEEEDGPPILLSNKHKEEDALTISTAGTKDSLFSFSKLSWDGSTTLVPANEDVQVQLQTWKQGAVIGTPLVRISAMLAASAAIVATIFLMTFEDYWWTTSSVICAMHTILSGMLIMILEEHQGLNDEEELTCPEEASHFRDRLRHLITRNMNMLKMVWGRGALYMYTGSMALTINHFVVSLPGVVLIFIGIIAVAKGLYAGAKLETLKVSFSDETLLQEKFVQADHEHVRSVNPKQFRSLVWSLGLQVDEDGAAKLFDEIDTAHKGRISFSQFKTWWLREPSGNHTLAAGRRGTDNRYVLSKPGGGGGKHRKNPSYNAALDAVV